MARGVGVLELSVVRVREVLPALGPPGPEHQCESARTGLRCAALSAFAFLAAKVPPRLARVPIILIPIGVTLVLLYAGPREDSVPVGGHQVPFSPGPERQVGLGI